MNKLNIVKKIFFVFSLVFVVFASASCDLIDNIFGGGNKPVDQVVPTIAITANKDTISKGERVAFTVTVENSDNGYTWSFSEDNILQMSDTDVLSVIADIKVDKNITVRATINDTNISATKTIRVKAPIVEGQVGYLTSEVIQELGNSSITVEAKTKDYYINFDNESLSHTNEYDSVVKMEDGKWSGSWSIVGKKNSTVTNTYKRGDYEVTDEKGNSTGHAKLEAFINKDNQVEYREIKDYKSVPTSWESQHLWNHLANLCADANWETKFEYDPDHGYYRYMVDSSDVDVIYLMAYFAFSLTPMLGNDDIFTDMYFVLAADDQGVYHITQMVAATAKVYEAAGGYTEDVSREDAVAYSYTECTFTFKDIGSTTVDEPAPYTVREDDQQMNYLKDALEVFKSLDNYTFKAVETTTYAPALDGDDYSMDGVSGGVYTTKSVSSKSSVYNKTSKTGTVGLVGYVTNEAVLLARTGEYSATLDGYKYHTEYSGYKQIDANHYDFFEYNSHAYNLGDVNEDGEIDYAGALCGQKRMYGSLVDILPKFEFSYKLFKADGYQYAEDGETKIYGYYLKESTISRDIAQQVSLHTNASSAVASVSNKVMIYVAVDTEGNATLNSIVYPYSLSGVYGGYVSTTYSKINQTTIADDVFEGYKKRVVPSSWSQLIMKYYHPTFSTLDNSVVDPAADTVIAKIFGSDASKIPSPDFFIDIFGDNVYGPFYDWKAVDTDAQGNEINHAYFSINICSDTYDENMQLTKADWDNYNAQLLAGLNALGYTKDLANSTSNYTFRNFSCFINGKVQIVIENIHTRYFYIHFYQTGDWIYRP